MNILKNYKFVLQGLGCPNCAKKIENKVASIEGYKDVIVNFSTLTLSLKTDKENGVEEEVKKIVKSVEPDVKVVSNDEKNVEAVQRNNKDIIRNKRKINASINNSKIFKTIVDEYGSFYNYLRTFTKDRTIYETNKTTNDLSDALSKDLQNRGMTFVGSVIIYAYLQAIGVIYSHDKDCYLYKSGE